MSVVGPIRVTGLDMLLLATVGLARKIVSAFLEGEFRSQ